MNYEEFIKEVPEEYLISEKEYDVAIEATAVDPKDQTPEQAEILSRFISAIQSKTEESKTEDKTAKSEAAPIKAPSKSTKILLKDLVELCDTPLKRRAITNLLEDLNQGEVFLSSDSFPKEESQEIFSALWEELNS